MSGRDAIRNLRPSSFKTAQSGPDFFTWILYGVIGLSLGVVSFFGVSYFLSTPVVTLKVEALQPNASIPSFSEIKPRLKVVTPAPEPEKRSAPRTEKVDGWGALLSMLPYTGTGSTKPQYGSLSKGEAARCEEQVKTARKADLKRTTNVTDMATIPFALAAANAELVRLGCTSKTRSQRLCELDDRKAYAQMVMNYVAEYDIAARSLDKMSANVDVFLAQSKGTDKSMAKRMITKAIANTRKGLESTHRKATAVVRAAAEKGYVSEADLTGFFGLALAPTAKIMLQGVVVQSTCP
jgi:hypothetical protein